MRTDQMIGLNERGRKLVQDLVVVDIEAFEGAWNIMRLLTWGYPGGMGQPAIPVYYEYVQADPWSSGPCYFLALKDAVGNNPVSASLWTESEINVG